MSKILSPRDFEKKMDEIMDFTPYLTHQNNKYRKLMAQYGKEIDALLNYDYGWTSDIEDVKIQLINNGYAKEHWEEWKTDRQLVREALVRQGYDLNYFRDDESDSVRFTLVKYYPKLIPELIEYRKSKEDYDNAFLSLANSHDKDLIKYLIENYDNYHPERQSRFELESYQIAYESMSREPSLIEQTMSPCQMFQTGNVLWAKGLNKNQITTIRRYHLRASETGNVTAFFLHFNKIANPTNSIDDIHEIGRHI